MSRGKITDDPFFVHKGTAPSNTHKEKATNNTKDDKKQNKPFRNKSTKSKNTTEVAGGDKKPFDKKKWRLQKYSKKYKLEQWENKRKKSVLREYYKSVKDDASKFDVKKIYGETESDTDKTATIEEAPLNNTNRKRKPHKKAHLEFLRIQEEKQKKKEEAVKKKAEREEALKNYKQKKLEKFKKLNRKTRKGQPIMKERMELLLERIQKSVQNSP